MSILTAASAGRPATCAIRRCAPWRRAPSLPVRSSWGRSSGGVGCLHVGDRGGGAATALPVRQLRAEARCRVLSRRHRPCDGGSALPLALSAARGALLV